MARGSWPRRLGLLLVCALAAGCAKHSPSAPRTTPTTTVQVHVYTRAGADASGASVLLESVFPINGYQTSVVGTTDSNGFVSFDSIPYGSYIAGATAANGEVRADTLRVDGGGGTAELDLVLPSRLSGRATLANRTRHENTIVTCDGAVFATAVTDSSGAWTLGNASPGNWTVTFSALGFQVTTEQVVVPAENSDITVPDVVLLPEPGGP